MYYILYYSMSWWKRAERSIRWRVSTCVPSIAAERVDGYMHTPYLLLTHEAQNPVPICGRIVLRVLAVEISWSYAPVFASSIAVVF